MPNTLFDPQRAHRPVTVCNGLSRPEWTRERVGQTTLLSCDGSGSMDGQKARDADAAAKDLVVTLAAPENHDVFSVGVIHFGSDVQVVAPITKATALVNTIPPLVASGFTNITGALVEAKRMLDANASITRCGRPSARPVVILFSDGRHNVGEAPHAAAAALKADADLVTVAFGSDADEALLTAIATSPNHFYRCRDGKELRRFFVAVGTAMTKSVGCGMNAGAGLATIAP